MDLDDPGKFDARVFDRRIDRILARGRKRHAALCEALTTFLTHYTDADGTFEGAWQLEIASRIDSSDHPGCLAVAVAALPAGKPGDALLEDMRFDCINNPWVGPGRHQSCNRFRRPAAAP